MTFVAAFRGDDSVVLGADTQETVNEDKINYAEKIKTIEGPWGALAIAGAGRADLCDAFPQAVEDGVKQWKCVTVPEIETNLKTILSRFYERDVAYVRGKRREIKFIVGLSSSPSHEVRLWRTSASRLLSVPKFSIIGYETPVYSYFGNRLKDFAQVPSQMVLVMAYLIGIAKETGTSVGGDSHIVVLRHGGAYPESKDYVGSVSERIARFREIADRLYFLSMDFAVQDDGFKGAMKETENVLLLLRSKYMHETARMVLESLKNPSWRGDAYPKLPQGTAILDDGGVVRLAMRIYIPILVEFETVSEFVTAAPSNWAERLSTPAHLVFEGQMRQNHETQNDSREKSSNQ